MLCRLTEHEESTAQVSGDYLVKHLDVAISDSSKRHDARAVHHHIDPREGVQRLFEETFYLGGVCHIRLHGDGLPACRLDLVHDSFGFGGVAGIVYDDCEPVASEP